MRMRSDDRFISAMAALRSMQRLQQTNPQGQADSNKRYRFITISRQAGAGGKHLAKQLVEALNDRANGDMPWAAWDQELIEKVADEHHIPRDCIASLEDAAHPWLSEFLAALSNARPADAKVFRRTAMTVRALAGAGQAVIVGRGGVFITTGLPGGLHLRLVAPRDYRIQRLARRMDASPYDAAKRLDEVDANRADFVARHWPDRKLTDDCFTLTLNTAELADDQLLACLLPLIQSKHSQQELKSTGGISVGVQRGGRVNV